MNKKWTKSAKRFFALFLCVAMVLPLFPQVVNATNSAVGIQLSDKLVAFNKITNKEVVTKNTAIKLVPVGKDEKIVQDGVYAFVSGDGKYMMYHDASSLAAGSTQTSTGSLKLDPDSGSVDTFYTADNGNIFIDHTDRDATLWILNQPRTYFDKSTNEYTQNAVPSGSDMYVGQSSHNYGHGTYALATNAFKGRVAIGGVIPKKGIKGTNGNYWNSTTNNNSYFLWAQYETIMTGADAFTDTFAPETGVGVRGWNDWYMTVGCAVVQVDDKGSFLFFRYRLNSVDGNVPDVLVMCCDENGKWAQRRYCTTSSGVAAAGAERLDKLFAGITVSNGTVNFSNVTVNEDELDKLKVRLYKFVADDSECKTLTVSGYQNYYYIQKDSSNYADEIALVAKNTKVFDKESGLAIPCCDASDPKVGHYYVDDQWDVYYVNDDSSTTCLIDTEYHRYQTKGAADDFGVAVTSKNSSYASILYEVARDANGNILTDANGYPLASGTPVTFPIYRVSEDKLIGEVAMTVNMLYKNDANGNPTTNHIDTSTPDKTGKSYTVKYGTNTLGTAKVYIAGGTIAQQMPGYPEPGSVVVHKNGTTTSDMFSQNGVANIQLSAAGTSISNEVDVVVIVDLSSSMRYTAVKGGKDLYGQTYYNADGSYNTIYDSADYKQYWAETRMGAMEASLAEMIETLKNAGVKANIAIADFGDLDHYDFDGATLMNQYKYIAPHIDMDGDRTWNPIWSASTSSGWKEFTNHLNYVMGSDDDGDYYGTKTQNRPFDVHWWKHWSSEINGLAPENHGKQASEIDTGGCKVGDAFSDVNDVDMDVLIDKLRRSNSQLLGTNYDLGLEIMYKIAYERQQSNIQAGVDRDIVCVFMSDGAAMQYNYFSGSAHSHSWNDYLAGNADSLTNSPYSWSLADADGDGKLDNFDNFHPVMKIILNEFQSRLHKHWWGGWEHVTYLRKDQNTKDEAAGYFTPCNNPYNNAGNVSTCTHQADGAYFLHCLENTNGVKLNWDGIFRLLYLNLKDHYWSTQNSNHLYEALHNHTEISSLINEWSYIDDKNGWTYWFDESSASTNNKNDPTNKKYILTREDIIIMEIVMALTNASATGAFETHSPFYYFYNAEGKNWWAEAIKGNTDELYPVINKYANKGVSFQGEKNPSYYNGDVHNNFSGKNTAGLALDGKPYISGFKGLGLEIYTIGFALANDGGVVLSTAEQVLGNIATQNNENYVFSAQTHQELAYALTTIAKKVTLGATQMWFTDTLGDDYDLLTPTTVKNRDGKPITLNITPTISVNLYTAANDGSPQFYIRTLEQIVINGAGSATSTVFNENGTINGTPNTAAWGADGVIRGSKVIYNTNQTSKKIDLTGDGVGDYSLAPETFFWTIGNLPETVIVLEYQVYLTGSMAGKYDPYPSTTFHDTNKSAVLHYVDSFGNSSTNETISPVYDWDPLEGVTLVVDYGLPVTVNVLEHTKYNEQLSMFVNGRSVASMSAPTVVGVRAGKITQDEYKNQGTNAAPTGYGNSATGTYGSVSLSDGNLTYTPSADSKLQMSDSDTFTYVLKDNKDNTYFYCYAVFVPATTIYYEDNHVSFSTYTKNTSTGKWDKTGNAWNNAVVPTTKQDMDLVGSGNIYGYDSHYTAMNQHSMNTARVATVDAGKFAEINFSFTGTGFDIISRTGSDTGLIMVDVKDKDGNYVVDAEFVDTYYGYSLLYCEYKYTYRDSGGWSKELVRTDKTGFASKNTPETNDPDSLVKTNPGANEQRVYYYYTYAWQPTDVSDLLYQIPVVKHGGLDYGTYNVTITIAYNEWLDHVPGSTSYDFYLDAIRIYDPANDGANDTTGLIEYVYEKDHEAKPTYTELRNKILEKGTFERAGGKTGIAFVDDQNRAQGTHGDTKYTPTVTDYENYGAKNEIYLLEGQSIVFKLGDNVKLDELHLAMKSVNNDTKVTIQYLEGGELVTLDGYNEKTIATATDLYYDISELAGKTVVITNSSTVSADSDSILSITNIKATYTDTPTNTETLDVLDANDIKLVFAAMTAEDTDNEPGQNPDQNEPEQNKPGQDQTDKEEIPGTGDAGIDVLAIVLMSACVMMLAVLTIVQSRKKNVQ